MRLSWSRKRRTQFASFTTAPWPIIEPILLDFCPRTAQRDYRRPGTGLKGTHSQRCAGCQRNIRWDVLHPAFALKNHCDKLLPFRARTSIAETDRRPEPVVPSAIGKRLHEYFTDRSSGQTGRQENPAEGEPTFLKLARTEAHPFARCVNPHLADLLGRLWLDKRFVPGEGCELIDDAGRRYLDGIAAYGAPPLGRNPAEIWESLWDVQRTGEPSFARPALLDAAGELAERLLAIAPSNLRM